MKKTSATASENEYVLGTHGDELGRLGLQHQLWAEYTTRAWERAGFGLGQKLLDVGCGPGYATFDLANRVGANGKVFAVDQSERFLGYLRSQGHEVVVIRTLDPVEVSFQFPDESMFFDLESGRELYVDPQAARAGYLERFEAHAKSLARVCSGLGIDVYQLTTDQPLDLALFDLLNSRMRRGRQVSRRRRVS